MQLPAHRDLRCRTRQETVGLLWAMFWASLGSVWALQEGGQAGILLDSPRVRQV